MKKVLNFLYSSKTTVVLLLILGAAMGAATFVEDKYDTETAKQLVYNAKWFEILFLLLTFNFIGNIAKYRLLSPRKLTSFLFHFAFIVMIFGAGITRYFGYNGTMHIRQGEVTNTFYTSDPYLRVMCDDNEKDSHFDMPVHLSMLGGNDFGFNVTSKSKGDFEVKYVSYIKGAVDSIYEDVPGGKDMLCLVVPGENGRETAYLQDGEKKPFGKINISFNYGESANTIRLFKKDGVYYINSPFEIVRTAMPAMTTDTIRKDSNFVFKEKCLYNLGESVFVFKKGFVKARKDIVSGKSESGADGLKFSVKHGNKKDTFAILGGTGFIANYQEFKVDNNILKVAFGAKELELPFALKLNEFVLERYPGSMSPSSFLSKVNLVDPKDNIDKPYEIFMNHVLDYKGYRFFQTSYDPDEKGTILSVNHDAVGTWVSYFGYFILGLGFLLTLLNKNSRFYTLATLIKKMRVSRSAMAATLLLIGLSSNIYAQTEVTIHVSADQAEKFGKLVTQTFDGRFEPVNTLAFDVMHKLSRKDEFSLDGVGKMRAMQAFMDMPLNPMFWKGQKIIYIKEKSVQDLLGITGKYASFNDFFTDKGEYKIRAFAETSFRKKQSEQNAFDKEIIKIDERANICMMVFNGSMLKIFPLQNSKNNLWVSWDDTLAQKPLSGNLKILNEDLQLRDFNYNSIMGYYMQEVYKGAKYGNYSQAEKILNYINSIQKQSDAAKIIPDDAKIQAEINYNNFNIFVKLRDFYGFVSMILLLLTFIDVLMSKKNKILTGVIYSFVALLGVAFVFHTYGLILRWYLTGHAPWSTGYEALLFIGWGGILAGFFFIRNSKITIAATSLLAFFVLMTASHSSYDPQLTNLQPVLKSYWLIIHVACLTISYGFLGLGFVLGLINLAIYLFKNKANYKRLDFVTSELTHINEMNLSIGLFLATVGTFLGGIWANESWGKYWGWDAKETWALVIVITYTMVLHLRLIPKMQREYVFNIGSVLGYASVLMTFFGVNYYLSKGLHSYAQGESTIFPLWAWISIISIIVLIVIAGMRQHALHKIKEDSGEGDEQ